MSARMAIAPGRARRAALMGVLAAPAFMVVLDSNMVTVALPSIRTDLHFSRSGLQWVIGAFSLGFGGSLLVAGRAGDLFGRRRLLVMGLVALAVASIAAALAPSRAVLLGARLVEGLGAAMALPASLALITSLFEEGDSRNRALGAYGVAVSAAFVTGVVAGGLLTSLGGWRSLFVVNAPLGAAAAVAAGRLVAEDRAHGRARDLDLPGAAAAAGAVLALLSALALGAPALAALGVLLAAAAWGLELRSPAPLLPAGLLRSRTVASACLAALLTVGTGVGVMFVLTLYLQEGLGYDPAASGLALAPLGVAGVSAGLAMPRVVRALGLPRALAAALAVQAAGVGTLISMAGLPALLVGVAVVGAGHFGATVAFTALATGGVARDRHGVTMGLVSSAQQIGGALGLALLVAVGGVQRALAVGAAMSLLAAAVVLALNGRAPPRPPVGRTRRRPAR